MGNDPRISVNGLGPHATLEHGMMREKLMEQNDTLAREVAFLYQQLYEERLKLSRVIGYMNEFKRLFNKRK